MSDAAAGWYPDPTNDLQERWWDGEAWTEVQRPTAQQAPEPPAAVMLEPVAPSAPAQAAELPAFSPTAPVAAATQYPPFHFDGGAGTYFGTGLLAALVTILSLGIALPFAIVLRQRWLAKHTYIEGRRLMFTGTGIGLFGHWIKWWLLMIVTLGIYSFWVIPRLTKWKVEHQAFDPRSR